MMTDTVDVNGKRQEIVVAASKAYADWRTFMKSYAEMLPKLRELKSVVGDEANAKRTIGDEEFAQLKRIMERKNAVVQQDPQRIHLRMTTLLKTIFTSRTSQTHEVASKVNGGFAVTIGKFGFGVRYNINSREVGRYELEQFMKRSDEIVAGLKQIRHLVSTAKDFEDFVQEYKKLELLRIESIKVPLRHPVLLFKKNLESVTSKEQDMQYHSWLPYLADRVRIDVDTNNYRRGEKNLTMHALPTAEDSVVNGERVYAETGDDDALAELSLNEWHDGSMRLSGIMQAMMMKDQFEFIANEFEKATAKYLENEKVIVDIENRFGRRLMMSSI